jgi:hypothetical protein
MPGFLLGKLLLIELSENIKQQLPLTDP